MTSYLKKIFLKKSNDDNTPVDGIYVCNRNDYDATFYIPKKILRWITIQMTHDNLPTTRKWWDWYYWFEFTNILIAMVLEFLSMVETARGGSFQDAVKIFRMLPCFGMASLGLVKSFSMVHHRPVYENLVYEVGDMWHGGRISEDEWTIINTANKQLLFVMKGYYWCNNALLISFLSPPVFEAIKRMLGYENEMLLQFFYWLPFDPFQPVYIDILLLIQTWQALIVIWSNICGDLLFCAFLSHITTQFDLLSLRIQKFVYVPIDNQLIGKYPLGRYSKEHLRNSTQLSISSGKKLDKDLGEIIHRHKTLIRLSGDVESLFTFSLFMNFINSSLIICFCGFCCVVVEQWNEFAYKSFLLTALSQTFLICWYGQKLLDSSVGVSRAIYNSGWYMAPRRVKSAMIIMLYRSQKQVRVTTYGFSVVSLESYTKGKMAMLGVLDISSITDGSWCLEDTSSSLKAI